jgi:tetratricopeptide (TPR) repeat protein
MPPKVSTTAQLQTLTQGVDLALRMPPRFKSRFCLWKKQYDRAIPDYDQAIQLDPKNACAHVNRGNAYLSTDQHDLAIADYIQALRLDPADADYLSNRSFPAPSTDAN